MNIIDSIGRRLRQRRPAPRLSERDWSNALNPRDWADLPVHHPRREDDAR